MSEKILITGGAGFVGSNLARYILERDEKAQITILDDFFTGLERNIKGLNLEVVRGDVADAALIDKHVKGKDVVYHLAARNVIVSGENPLEDIRTNIIGSYTVFQACYEHRTPRVVYSSTSSMYGNAESIPVDEGKSPQFLNNYSVSKYAAEGYAQCFWERFQLPISMVRYSNAYGYNQHPTNPYSGVIGKFIGWALEGKPLRIHGDGHQTRDFTFIDDACAVTVAAARSPRAIGQIYNVGTSVETSVNQLADMILELTGSDSEIQHVERRDIDNIRRRALSIEKARHELRVMPKTTLAEGLAKTVAWEKSLLT
jgi:UDP-glucose 4-epimerase